MKNHREHVQSTSLKETRHNPIVERYASQNRQDDQDNIQNLVFQWCPLIPHCFVPPQVLT